MWYISPCMKRKPEPNEPMMFAHRGWVLLLNEEQLAWCDIDRSRNQRLGMSKASAVGMVAARSARWHPGRWILGPKSQGTHFPWVSKMRIWTKFFFCVSMCFWCTSICRYNHYHYNEIFCFFWFAWITLLDIAMFDHACGKYSFSSSSIYT